MDILGFLRERGSPPDPTDEMLYEFIAAELANSVVKQGLWTKALSDANWDESGAKSLYVKMRVQQLRTELLRELTQSQALPTDPVAEARAFGLSEAEIEYLGRPVKAVLYIEKQRISKDKLSKAIGLGKLRAVLCREVLWVQDKPTV